MDTERIIADNIIKRGQLSKVRWSSVRFRQEGTSADPSSDTPSETGAPSEQESPSNDVSQEEDSLQPPVCPKGDPVHRQTSEASHTSDTQQRKSDTQRIIDLLDRWQDPLNKQDKVRKVTQQRLDFLSDFSNLTILHFLFLPCNVAGRVYYD